MNTNNIRKLFAAMLVLALMLTPLSGMFAANGQHINVTALAPTSATVMAGQLYTLDLTRCFTDTYNHGLTYSINSNNDLGPHTHLGPENVEDHLYFTVQYPGNYSITVTASCANDSASFVLPITVTPAPAGSTAQYDYLETSASSVTVYVTVSNDGMPLLGNDDDATKLACLEVELPYFDLEDYGLEDYWRYDSSGSYVVARPTLLHLYIYLLERYYMGLDVANCLTGETGVLGYDDYTEVSYMDGTPAYDNGSYYSAMSISGSPQSLYFTNFWGHDDNLMYFRNHMYPLMSAGWGATADYILLKDGDYIDVAMFSDPDFRFEGAFVSFQAPVFEAVSGEDLDFEVQKFDTSAAMGGTGGLTDMEDSLTFYVYSENYDGTWSAVSNPSITHTANTNDYSITLTTGTYYVVATEPGAPDAYACLAPAAMKIIVAAP